VLERLRQVFGTGGPRVATTLDTDQVIPGSDLSGTIKVVGGSRPVTVSRIVLGLSTKVNVDGDDVRDDVFFGRQAVTGSFRLAPGEETEYDFAFLVPYETPLSSVAGVELRDIEVALRTQVDVARGFDSLDSDPIRIDPLPAQNAIGEALLALGFRVLRSDVEHGSLRGVDQTLPFYQEIEFHPSAKYAAAVNRLEVTFVGGPFATQVVLELDRRGVVRLAGRDVFGRFVVDHSRIADTNWKGKLDDWIMESCRKSGLF
jgi:sporulation-control protein